MRRFVTGIAILVTVVFVAVATQPAQAQQQQSATEQQLSIWRVTVETDADIDKLLNGGYDLMEARDGDALFVLGDEATAERLRAEGLAVLLDRRLEPLPALGGETRGEARLQSFYGGYRSVDEHDEHLASVAASFPDLATVVDYGDSWLKQNGLAGGNDLFAICLTDKQPGDCELEPSADKPRAMVITAIHARELQTAEVAWRLIDLLVTEFGNDADITYLLETTEVWIIPIVNPDGRQIVELGGNTPYLQRKNANDTLGRCAQPPTAFDQLGVDLNRNADDDWGASGTSNNPCAQTWPGASPASEPEVSALQDLFAQLWLDQKGARAEPAPETTTGTFLTLHSFGDLILLPALDDGTIPNAGLSEWAFRQSHYNGYVTGPAGDVLYSASGTTDDYVYFEFGVPSATYEISPREGLCAGFTPVYQCVDQVLWPLNRDALLYSLKVAGAPYLESRGPTTTDVAVELIDGRLRVTASADDDAYGDADGSVNRPTASAIAEARYFVDVAPESGGSPNTMRASDVIFDESSESVESFIDTAGLATGDHAVYVQARNDAGFWGPITAASFTYVRQGDVDQDGDIDAADSQAVLEYLVGLAPASFDAAAADINADGAINLFDALLLAAG